MYGRDPYPSLIDIYPLQGSIYFLQTSQINALNGSEQDGRGFVVIDFSIQNFQKLAYSSMNSLRGKYL